MQAHNDAGTHPSLYHSLHKGCARKHRPFRGAFEFGLTIAFRKSVSDQ